MNKITPVIAALACGVLLMNGCGEESINQPSQGTLGLNVAFDLSSPDMPLVDINNRQRESRPPDVSGPDSITVTGGLAMVRSLRFVADPSAVIDTSITAADEQRDLGDASVRFRGPYILVVDDTQQGLATSTVPSGNYSQLRFVFQKARPTDNLGTHPELLGSSVRVTGMVWHGSRGKFFTFTTDITTEVAVNGSYTVSNGATGSLSLQFHPARWFYSGEQWLDPTDPANRLAIMRNLGRNISAQLGV